MSITAGGESLALMQMQLRAHSIQLEAIMNELALLNEKIGELTNAEE